MFILTKIADVIQIHPKEFGVLSIHALTDAINTKYANKLVLGVGLCICLQDILWHSEGLLGQGDGLASVNAEFTIVVFRPFKSEVIQARIASQTAEGMRLSTEFFDNIYVPRNYLPDDCEFRPVDGIWVWKSDGQELFYDNNEIVRIRICGEEWHDQASVDPVDMADESAEALALSGRRPMYQIIGSMDDVGLGACIWWDE
ncbi:RNA polymerase III subunit Rpc25-domain-containing protein [Podospora fimiseda]|uniref:DNA-directed RNA polymerase subunit n=1 Tax=Podospora fimiseda TaxID=252190 RepID=A0AAN6YM66_9PEZI|nr:RNA polymerase III subunit Rpc25-domain-containing protein [Podospora fimiseda]